MVDDTKGQKLNNVDSKTVCVCTIQDLEPFHISVTIATINQHFFKEKLFCRQFEGYIKRTFTPNDQYSYMCVQVFCTTVYMFGRRRLLCKKAGCQGDIMSFFQLSRMHFCLTEVVQYVFIKCENKIIKYPYNVIISCVFVHNFCQQFIFKSLPIFNFVLNHITFPQFWNYHGLLLTATETEHF